MYNYVNYYLLKHKSFQDIKTILEMNDSELLSCIQNINDTNTQTIPVKMIDGEYKILYSKREFEIFKLQQLKREIQLMIVSDKHIDHVDDRIEYINAVYEEAEKRRVDYVFDLGDILNGPSSKVHNAKKVRTGTLEGCMEQLTDYHPKNLKTYFITGNHDLKFLDSDDCNIGKLIENECSNMVFLGNLFRCVQIGNFRINLSHGSYEEKIISNIDLKKEFPFLSNNNPHVICQGHFHVSHEPICDDILKCQVPTLKACFSDNKKKNSQESKNTGAIFLKINELSDSYEIEHEEIRFVENQKILKKEISINKTKL